MSADAPAVKAAEAVEGEEIRRFAHSGIQSAIESAVASIPAGKTFAVVAHYDLTGRARLAAMVRVKDEWSFAGHLAHNPSRGFSGEAAVMWSR